MSLQKPDDPRRAGIRTFSISAIEVYYGAFDDSYFDRLRVKDLILIVFLAQALQSRKERKRMMKEIKLRAKELAKQKFGKAPWRLTEAQTKQITEIIEREYKRGDLSHERPKKCPFGGKRHDQERS